LASENAGFVCSLFLLNPKSPSANGRVCLGARKKLRPLRYGDLKLLSSILL
jgi:hypothetical protein